MTARLYEGEIHQGKLVAAVKQLFGSGNVQQNVRKLGEIKNPFTGSYLELDVWVPNSHICFEFQDNYHYVHTWYSQTALDATKQKDAAKHYLTRTRGLTLIQVPCWWDGSNESLLSSIRFQRPDLLHSSNVAPMSLNPTSIFFSPGKIPDVGELMLASFPETLPPIDEENPWWTGEKYDGIRFCWHPKEKDLFSRYGMRMDLMDPFYDHLGDTFYDGEIWFGRGWFAETQKMITLNSNIDWPTLRAVIFDDAAIKSRLLSFEERYSGVLISLENNHPFAMLAARIFCTSSIDITNWLQSVIDDGGEGTIARAPKSLYEAGRSPMLFKLKASRGDKEALVVAVDEGAVHLHKPDGIIFTVPKPNVTLQMGDIVTITYDRYSRFEVPVNPVIQRVRSDVAWEDILRDFAENSSQNQVLSDYTNKIIRGFTTKPFGFWKPEKAHNSRTFFMNFAKENKFDPLVAENWYSMRPVFHAAKGAKSILSHHNNNFSQALMEVFPDIGIIESKMDVMPRNYWSSLGNRKECFNAFANKMGFDPLEPKNWYFATFLDILNEFKGAVSVISYYGGIAETLQHLYPDIGFVEGKIKIKRFYMQDVEHRRRQFIEFAQTHNFEPLSPDGWYSVAHKDLFSHKAIVSMLPHYRGNFVNALVLLFPDISFDRSLFKQPEASHWQDKTKQKNVFESFAAMKESDPLNAQFWYNTNYDEVLSVHGAWDTLKEYRGDMSKALISLFPNINLTKSGFTDSPSIVDVKQFFTTFARDYGFDALLSENWFPLNALRVAHRKGAREILTKYGGRVWTAVSAAFPDINLRSDSFKLSQSEHWNELENRKRFFMQFAKRKGFDPLIANNWYSVTRADIYAEKNAGLALQHHNGSFNLSLMESFPNIGLDAAKFSVVTRNYWSDKQNRKRYFDDLALKNHFDPLIAEHWYSFPFASLSFSKNPVTAFYNGSYRKALSDIYPSVTFESSRFDFAVQRRYWDDKNNRKKFFDEFASENQFNPLVPENWYRINMKRIYAKKGSQSVLHHYNGNLASALVDAYPDIAWKEQKFQSVLSNHWLKAKTRRKFFDEFAKENHFDPLVAENWYNTTIQHFQTKKHANSVLQFHKGSMKKALLDLYPDVIFNPKAFAEPPKLKRLTQG